jgi:antitoxin component YwqK of YwqJK toxin-antitoxin module
VELFVNCAGQAKANSISVLEYQQDAQVQHGFAIHYDGKWRKQDSCMFVHGKENGRCVFWDSLGNVTKVESYRNGSIFGKRETWWSPGRPAVSKIYDAKGKETGPWLEWWENGNRKAEYLAKGGRIVTGTEYYHDGKRRVRYVKSFDPVSPFKVLYSEGEAWAPNGKSTGRIVKGEGAWILFPDGHDSADHVPFHESYLRKSLVRTEKLDSAQAAIWSQP